MMSPIGPLATDRIFMADGRSVRSGHGQTRCRLDPVARDPYHGCRRRCKDSVASAMQEKCLLRVSPKPRPVHTAKLMDEKNIMQI